jgi:hypothetical protein
MGLPANALVVMVFTRHHDSFIVKQNLSSVYQIRYSGSGQILHPKQFYLSPGLATITPLWIV